MDTISFPDPSLLRDGSSSQYIWLEITPKKMAYTAFQTTSSVSLSDVTEEGVYIYRFLLPREIAETTNHVWSPMESIYMKINQKIASLANSVEQGTARFRVDTPLLYDTTENRGVTLQFNFAYYGLRSNDPYKEVVEPIINMKKWSAPQKADAFNPTSPVELPYVFTIRTVDGSGQQKPILNIRAAAITSVQPTYKGPYYKGYPTNAELTLSFTDIEPNYKDSYKNIENISSGTFTDTFTGNF